MKRRRTFRVLACLLGSVAGSAGAAGTYSLAEVNAYNPFSPGGTVVVSGPVPTAGLAIVNSAGDVSVSGVSLSDLHPDSTFNYVGGVWAAVVGGTSVVHTETCAETSGTVCTAPQSGLAGVWTSTQQNGGGPTSTCLASLFFPAGNCDRVSIEEIPGVSLTVIEQSEFAIPGLPSGIIWRFRGPYCRDFAARITQNTVNNAFPTASQCIGFAGPVTLSLVMLPANGSASVGGADLIYTPGPGFFGVDTLTYQGTDGSSPGFGSLTITVDPDTDGDGIGDPNDNCTLASNASQLNADGDAFGNLCDADLNNSGLVTSADFALLRTVLGQSASAGAIAAAADLNGSGTVTTADFALLRVKLGKGPGPAGTLP